MLTFRTSVSDQNLVSCLVSKDYLEESLFLSKELITKVYCKYFKVKKKLVQNEQGLNGRNGTNRTLTALKNEKESYEYFSTR